MTGLPHYNNARASVNGWEPVTSNFFELTLFTPGNADTGLMLEHVKSVSGLNGSNPSIEPIMQKYKFADRSYAGIPGQTYMDLSVVFTLNLNDAHENYIYNMIRDWTMRIYNPNTGEMRLKNDYIGSCVIVIHDRAGNIYRRLTCTNIFPTGQIQMQDSLDQASAEATDLTINFRCDTWFEENVGEEMSGSTVLNGYAASRLD